MYNPKVLVVTPNISLFGGVANLYKTLDLERFDTIEYFELYYGSKETEALSTLCRLIRKYIDFFLKVNKFDIIHINPSLGKRSFFRDLIFILLAKRKKKKVIVFWHGWDTNFEDKINHNSFLRFLFQITYGKVDSFIVLGNIFKEKLLKLNVKSDNFIICTPAISTNGHSIDITRKYSNLETINILFISRLVKEKGILIVIKAFEKLAQKNKPYNINLHIVGDGPDLGEVREFIVSKRLSNVFFHGKVDNKKKHQIYKDSHILFFPTYYPEGLPAVIPECMYYGMPVISRPNAAIPDWVINDENGYLTDSIDHEDYVVILEMLLSDPGKVLRIAHNNHNKAVDNFTREKVVEKLLIAYKNV